MEDELDPAADREDPADPRDQADLQDPADPQAPADPQDPANLGDRADPSESSEPELTGVPAADAALARLRDVETAPLEDHVEIFDDVQRRLHEGLAELDDEQ